MSGLIRPYWLTEFAPWQTSVMDVKPICGHQQEVKPAHPVYHAAEIFLRSSITHWPLILTSINFLVILYFILLFFETTFSSVVWVERKTGSWSRLNTKQQECPQFQTYVYLRLQGITTFPLKLHSIDDTVYFEVEQIWRFLSQVRHVFKSFQN